MTVLLVLTMVSIFLLIDYFNEKKKERESVRSTGLSPNAWRYLHDTGIAPNHTWLRPDPDGLVTLGIDHFLCGLVGSPDAITLPRAGNRIGAKSGTIEILKDGKVLHLSPPIAGHVISVNTKLLKHPKGIGWDPYGAGWCLKILPEDPVIRNVFQIPTSIEWIRKQFDKAKEFLANKDAGDGILQPVFIQDGGLPIDGALTSFDQEVWREFEEEFLRCERTQELVRKEASS